MRIKLQRLKKSHIVTMLFLFVMVCSMPFILPANLQTDASQTTTMPDFTLTEPNNRYNPEFKIRALGSGYTPGSEYYYVNPGDGDNWTENNATQWENVNNVTLIDDALINQVGSYSIKAVHRGFNFTDLGALNSTVYIDAGLGTQAGIFDGTNEIYYGTGDALEPKELSTGVGYGTGYGRLYKVNVFTGVITNIALPAESTDAWKCGAIVKLGDYLYFTTSKRVGNGCNHYWYKLDLSDDSIVSLGSGGETGIALDRINCAMYDGSQYIWYFIENRNLGMSSYWKRLDTTSDTLTGKNEAGGYITRVFGMQRVGGYIYFCGIERSTMYRGKGLIVKMNMTNRAESIVDMCEDTVQSPTGTWFSKTMNRGIIYVTLTGSHKLYALDTSTDTLTTLGDSGKQLYNLYFDGRFVWFGTNDDDAEPDEARIGYYNPSADSFTFINTFTGSNVCTGGAFSLTNNYLYFSLRTASGVYIYELSLTDYIFPDEGTEGNADQYTIDQYSFDGEISDENVPTQVGSYSLKCNKTTTTDFVAIRELSTSFYWGNFTGFSVEIYRTSATHTYSVVRFYDSDDYYNPNMYFTINISAQDIGTWQTYVRVKADGNPGNGGLTDSDLVTHHAFTMHSSYMAQNDVVYYENLVIDLIQRNREFYYNSAKNLNLDCENRYEDLNFRIRQDNETADPQLRLYDDDSNYFYRTIDISANNTWQTEAIAVGSGSTGWSVQGSPNWYDIDCIGVYYTASQSNITETFIDNLYLDSSRIFEVDTSLGAIGSATITPSYTTGIDETDLIAVDGDSFTAVWDTDHWDLSDVEVGIDGKLDFSISSDFEGHNTTLSFSNWLEDKGVSISNIDPSNNERVGYETKTVKCTVTQLTLTAANISSVKFRYTFENPVNQYEIYSKWIEMSLDSGNSTLGNYKGSFEVNSTFFDEDDDYKLQIRAENTNGLTEKETITFFADSTPESGLQLGSLHEPEEVKCGNVTEDLMFWCTATIHESQLVYTKTLSNSFKEKLGDDFDLVTAVAVSTKNVTNLKFKEEGSKWKLTLEFDEAPTEDASFKIYFYETEPEVSSPAVVNADNNKAVYTMDIDTQIARENVSIIGIDLPSIRKLYWAGYTTDSIKSWKIYTDSKLQNEISSAASATLLDYLSNEESGYSVEFMPNGYEGTISIYGINIEPDQTLYLVGYVKEKTYTLTIEPFIYALSISIIGIVVVQSTKDMSPVKKFYQKYAFYVYIAIFGAAGVTLCVFLFLPQFGGVLSLTDLSEWSVTFRKPAINLASPVFAFVPITVAIVVILWSHVAKAGPVYESYRKNEFQWHIGLISGGGLFSLLIAVAGSIGALNVAEAPVEVQMLTQFGVYGFFTFIVIFGIILLRYFKGDRRRFR
ncbi:hypothetical protein [Candidatus Borrarchaeum sp.]|uniref:hypothetical protein n=1 Tax=Candidatus Borrarchaeum sp. TaxID=2846742 RepID=UPI00257E8773|nr:hypothetical protein [Candidatus Borrarchaeum sp.]